MTAATRAGVGRCVELRCPGCGLLVWQYANAPTLLAMTPVQHMPHPDEDDDVAWADYYLVADAELDEWQQMLRGAGNWRDAVRMWVARYGAGSVTA